MISFSTTDFWYGDETLTTIVLQLTWDKIIQTPILIKFNYLFDLIFNNRFNEIPGKKYPGWRYAYNPCTPFDLGQNDPDADPHKLCRDVAVSFFVTFKYSVLKGNILHSFPFLIFLSHLVFGGVCYRSSHFLLFPLLVFFFLPCFCFCHLLPFYSRSYSFCQSS